jgi:MFS family permease
MLPLTAEFGWGRTDVSLALTAFTVALALTMPVVGWCVDHYGGRRVLLPSVITFGVLLLLIPVTVSKVWHLWLLFTLIGSLAAGANALPYLHILGAWFDRRRGLAFGLAMAGGGLGYAYVPPLLQWLIGQWGWRSGYVALGAIVLLVAAPIVGLVLRDTPQEVGLLPDGDAIPTQKQNSFDARAKPHVGAGRGTFLLLFGTFSLLTLCLYGLLAHLVPMLVDRGIAPTDAAWAAALLGIAILVSRAGVGYLIDRLFAPHVAAACFVLSAAGLAWFAAGAADRISVGMATCLVGLSIGAEIDLLAFLTSRYFGLQRFGTFYGVMFAGFLLGAAPGPVVYGAVFDAWGNYEPALIGAAGLLVLAALAMLILPAYKE